MSVPEGRTPRSENKETETVHINLVSFQSNRPNHKQDQTQDQGVTDHMPPVDSGHGDGIVKDAAQDMTSTADIDNGGDINQTTDDSPPIFCCLYRFNRFIRRSFTHNWQIVKSVVLLLLLGGYLVYFSYCMYHKFGDEPSICLLVGTTIGMAFMLHNLVKRFVSCPLSLSLGHLFEEHDKRGTKIRQIMRWLLYVLTTVGAVVILAVDVLMKRPQNLMSLGGLFLLIIFCFFISKNPEKINWHAVYWGMALQFWLAVLITRTHYGAYAFKWLADHVDDFLAYADKGSQFVFGATYLDHRFVFQMMPKVIFLNAMISVCYYLGLIQMFIDKFGKFLGFCIGTSPIESVNAATNLFLSLSESILVIKPFINDITSAELFAVLAGGYASIAGSVFGAISAFGAPLDHILTASVMSAPAALAFAKLLYPDEQKPSIKAEDAYKVDMGQQESILGALSKGAIDGTTIACYIVINFIVFMAALEFLDMTLVWFFERAGVEDFTFLKLMGYVLYPLVYVMGFEIQDCLRVARLLGLKIFTTSLVSFQALGVLVTNSKTLQNYTDTYNGAWSYIGDDVLLEDTNTILVGGVLTERSSVLATYMICGFSSLASIGISIGTIASVAPARYREVIKQAPLALLAGNVASFSTACVAGLLFTD